MYGNLECVDTNDADVRDILVENGDKLPFFGNMGDHIQIACSNCPPTDWRIPSPTPTNMPSPSPTDETAEPTPTLILTSTENEDTEELCFECFSKIPIFFRTLCARKESLGACHSNIRCDARTYEC